MADPTLVHLAEQLAAVRLASWQGLPSELVPGFLDDPPALVSLGTHGEAELVHLDDPRPGASARAWLRDGQVVLLEVAWRSGPPLDALVGLGEPEERSDVVDGLVPLEAGEWLFPRRGLVAVVDGKNRRVHHLLAFAPTTAADYRQRLQPDLATRRRPSQTPLPGEV